MSEAYASPIHIADTAESKTSSQFAHRSADDHAQSERDAASVVSALQSASRITALCHENPDADTLAGALAILIIGEQLGKQVEAVSTDPVPAFYDFLPRVREIRHEARLEPDVAVCLDAATLSRVGIPSTSQVGWLDRSKIVNIDHHVTNTCYGAVNLVDPSAGATCQVLAELVPTLGVSLGPELATLLLTGIVRDTRRFADASTTPRTLRITADLIDAGASLTATDHALHGSFPATTLRLWGMILSTLGQSADGRVIHASVTEAMMRDCGAEPDEAEGLVEMLATAKGAEIAVLLREQAGPSTRISVRTRAGVDASAIASPFGGGGHLRRAGGTIMEPLTRARPLVLEQCTRVAAGRLPSGI